MLKTTLYDLLSKKYSTDQVNEMLKNTKQSSPKLPLSGVMDDLALSDLENVKPNELNVARDTAKKQMALQELDSAIKPKVNASRGVTAADWAMDPEIGRDFEKTLQNHYESENLKRAMNSPRANDTLVNEYNKIKYNQRMARPPEMIPENFPEMEQVNPGSRFSTVNPATLGNSLRVGLAASAPLAIAEFGKHGGMAIGKQIADTGVDEMGQSIPSKEDLTPTPPTPPQQEPMVHSKGGIPFNPPLGLMEPKEEVQAPEATPESPQEQLVEQQSEGVNQKSDLQKTLDLYRELASEQSTGLRGAQEKSNQNEMFANLLKSANLISSGLSGIGSGGVVGPAKINNDVLDSLVKTSDRPVTEYKQQIEDQKNDPSSRYSQMLREYYAGLQKQKLGRDLNDEEISALRDTPGSVLNTLIPLAQKDLYSDRLSKIKEMVANQKKEKELQSQEDREESRYLRAQNRLSGIVNSALRDPDVQANKKKLSAVNRIYKTFGDLDLKSEDDVNKISKDYLNKFPKLLTTEAAQELNTLLSNSNVTPSSTLGKLMPDSLVMDVAGWRDYLTNSLGPARQEQFLRLVLKMAVRQKRAAIENTKEKIAPYINANEGMKKFLKDPADLLNAASSLGLEPKDLNPELAKEMEEKMKKQGIESSTTPSQKPNIASTNTLAGKVPAGQTITLKNGKKYKVAEDGDTLIEVK